MSSSLVGSDSTILALSDGDGVVNSLEGNSNGNVTGRHCELVVLNGNIFLAVLNSDLIYFIARSGLDCQCNCLASLGLSWVSCNGTILSLIYGNIVNEFTCYCKLHCFWVEAEAEGAWATNVNIGTVTHGDFLSGLCNGSICTKPFLS